MIAEYLWYRGRLVLAGVLVCAGPAMASDQSPSLPTPVDIDNLAPVIEREFLSFDLNYQSEKLKRQHELDRLSAELFSAEEAGHNVACSRQIFLETKWLVDHTADWSRADRRLQDLKNSLDNKDQAFATQQSSDDGSWGSCFEEWYMKVAATVGALERLAGQGQAPEHPVTLLDQIAEPDALSAYLYGLVVSDVASTGVNQRDELGSITASLATLLFKHDVAPYARDKVAGLKIDDAYVAAFQDFIDAWQDPATGYWGAWYESGGVVFRAPDLSLSYHQIAYHPHDITHLSDIIETTLRIKDKPYPYGWIAYGQFTNHNNYDVARILRVVWPYATEQQQEAIRDDLTAALTWCLNDSLNANGSFRQVPEFYNSVSADYYFGISFLDEIGYWTEAKRYWTDETFPNAQQTCCMIKARIKQIGLKSTVAQAALQKLNDGCPAC